jgi:hypothetical protein
MVRAHLAFSLVFLGACGSTAPVREEHRPEGVPEPTVASTPPAGAATAPAPVPDPLSVAAQAAVAERLRGVWTITRHVLLRPTLVERPVRPRAPTERPAERWTFHADGRFERALDTLASAGRWRVVGTVAAAEAHRAVAPEGWWVLALDEVTLSVTPDMAPRAEWALVAADRDSRVIVWLGGRMDPAAAELGGRFVASP